MPHFERGHTLQARSSSLYRSCKLVDLRRNSCVGHSCRLIAGTLIGATTEYYTSENYKIPAIAHQSQTGSATTIISVWLPVCCQRCS